MPDRPNGKGIMTSTVLGMAGAMGFLGYIGMGEGMAVLWNPPSLGIVLGGILVAALVAFRTSELAAALVSVMTIFREEEDIRPDIAELVEVARLLQRNQIHEAEERAGRVRSPFLRLGLQLIADAAPVNDILHVMTWRIQKMTEQEAAQARLFRTLAALSPAFGLLGTLVGLVGMMQHLGAATVEQIGMNMAVALTTTLYGVVLANIVFKPIAIKLEQRTARRAAALNVLLEGVLLVRLGRSPTIVAEALAEFVRERRDELHGAA
ncbi:motility protein A [Azospirillum halopraeferens]|uniref:motility protein A n=1 Tax=Azospirillum halopraeferens TaxID=34010 RepID=UPI000422131E|nr:MotA/TolQ/ExbB proton channel family protein [Azospirillum halopraeferens]